MAFDNFDWNRKKYGDRYSDNWEAIVLLSNSVFLYLSEADLRRKWFAQELAAIDRLRKVLEEREGDE